MTDVPVIPMVDHVLAPRVFLPLEEYLVEGPQFVCEMHDWSWTLRVHSMGPTDWSEMLRSIRLHVAEHGVPA